jgi:hypothetical protein
VQEKKALAPTENIVYAEPIAAAYDVEVAQNVVFKPNAGPQTEFLAATERQVLFVEPQVVVSPTLCWLTHYVI